jgi:hypothetical protein
VPALISALVAGNVVADGRVGHQTVAARIPPPSLKPETTLAVTTELFRTTAGGGLDTSAILAVLALAEPLRTVTPFKVSVTAR